MVCPRINNFKIVANVYQAKNITIPTSSSTRRMITRSATRRARLVFRFLDLPAEIRNLIYDYAIDVNAGAKLLDRYYQAVNKTRSIGSVKAPIIWSSSPTFLHINQQIYNEVVYLLKKRHLTFEHGLLDLADITEFVPKSIICTVSSITITDNGHPLFQQNILNESWVGHMTLIEQLAGILKEGHNLDKLTISFHDKDLIPHVTTCWNGDWACGFRDSFRSALNSLRDVHNIRHVTLHGVPEPFAGQLQSRMQSPPVSFLSLPRELRDQIYSECGDWSDTTQQLFRTMANWVCKDASPPYPKRSTPTVLLLNKRITAEAQPILRKKPLTIVCPGDHGMQKRHQVPNMLNLIKEDTLLQVRHLSIKLESWEWIYSLDRMLPILAKSANLKTVDFYFKDELASRFLSDPTQQYPDSTLHLTLNALTKLRGLDRVIFAGDLPSCYTEALVQIMQSPASSTAALSKLRALKGDKTTVEIEGDEAEADE